MRSITTVIRNDVLMQILGNSLNLLLAVSPPIKFSFNHTKYQVKFNKIRNVMQ